MSCSTSIMQQKYRSAEVWSIRIFVQWKHHAGFLILLIFRTFIDTVQFNVRSMYICTLYRYTRHLFGSVGVTTISEVETNQNQIQAVQSLENLPLSSKGQLFKKISRCRIVCNARRKEVYRKWFLRGFRLQKPTCETEDLSASKVSFKLLIFTTYYYESHEKVPLCQVSTYFNNGFYCVAGPYLLKVVVWEYLIRRKIREHEGLQRKYAVELRWVVHTCGAKVGCPHW